jgi:hypothetical protein
MKQQIKHRYTNAVLFECEVPDQSSGMAMRYALEQAVKARANLAGANLADANLAGAILTGAYLTDAILARANLAGAKGAGVAIAKTRILPDGDLIGWKKCKNSVIVKLRIPEAAKRSHAFGRKCRAEYADVLEVIGAEVAISSHDGKTEYRAGQRVTPDSFDENSGVLTCT